MPQANFLFSFRNCDSFSFQDLDTTLGGVKTEKSLSITFPDGNVLTFEDATFDEIDINTLAGSGLLGYDTHEILSDLDEWGFTDNILASNIEVLTEVIADYPSMFKDSEAANTSFSYEKFPSGVYKVDYSYERSGSEYTGTKYVLFTNTANSYLKEKIEWLFTNDVEEDTTEYQFNLVKDEVIKIIMLMHIAEFDFEVNAYEEANLKLQACDRLCESGVLGYKYDSAR